MITDNEIYCKYEKELFTINEIKKLFILRDKINECLQISGAIQTVVLLHDEIIAQVFNKQEILYSLYFLEKIGEIKEVTNFDISSVFRVFISND